MKILGTDKGNKLFHGAFFLKHVAAKYTVKGMSYQLQCNVDVMLF